MGDDENKSESHRTVLILSDTWSSTKEGIAAVTYGLASKLATYKGIKIYVNTVDQSISTSDRKEAERLGVELSIFENPTWSANIRNVTQIIGHAPFNHQLALKLKDEKFIDSEVLSFFHTTIDDVSWTADNLPYSFPTMNELVNCAERSSAVYSVTEKVHFYWSAKFRNRAKKPIDHRLYEPLSHPLLFQVPPVRKCDEIRLLVLTDNNQEGNFCGEDIGACAVSKLAELYEKEYDSLAQKLKLIIGTHEKAGELSRTRDRCQKQILQNNLPMEVIQWRDVNEMLEAIHNSDVVLAASRCEPMGFFGLAPLCAGVPCLISENSTLAPLVQRLTTEPHLILTPTTPLPAVVRQDATTWAVKLKEVLSNMNKARRAALQFQKSLRNDGKTKKTHDDMVAFCINGLRIKHQVTKVNLMASVNEEHELSTQRSLNKFICYTLKQCWRLKHHPLTLEEDLQPAIPSIQPDLNSLVKNVIDKIEARGRRILAVEGDTNSFIVHCPTAEAASDLWASCDIINDSLFLTLLASTDESHNPVLNKFRIRSIEMRTHIDGPEFLKYKKALLLAADRADEAPNVAINI
ncbi:DgyrCDS8478 [Dimorphilus gyrociliatus]|uniref:DgyrCDS8478 n=1 Tax=Dimorphilus gyrociliatus TaxID=2664684 RepID=A0A7I8VVT2_9ANNE|nr:DgyrCDS8478 [Dimorphilus gyrociliatus]